MKKLLLFLFLLLSFFSKAQTSVYHPFPEDSATWITDDYSNYCTGFNNYCESRFYEMKGDTAINSISYKKLYLRDCNFDSNNFSSCSYTGAIRQDTVNKKVYFVDTTTTTEALFYDFDLSIGDTVRNWYNRTNIQWPIIVSSIDSFSVNGNYRKYFHFQGLFQANLGEGIGWMEDLFGYLISGDGAMRLACFNGNNFGAVFPNECSTQLACSFSTNVKEQSIIWDINISPNPAHDNFTITLNRQIHNGELKIYDVMGKMVMEEKLHSQLSSVNCQLSGGIYFLKMLLPDTGEELTGKIAVSK